MQRQRIRYLNLSKMQALITSLFLSQYYNLYIYSQGHCLENEGCKLKDCDFDSAKTTRCLK